MKQISLATTGFELVTKRTCKREFLDEINQGIPWSQLLALIAPHAPSGKTGRPQFATEVMLRIHLPQQFFGHSDPAVEEPLHDIPLYREFSKLDAGITRLPDESTILSFRHVLEQNDLGAQILAAVNAKLIDRGLMLKTGTVVDATLIAAPSCTKNDKGERDPEMHQTKKGNQWHFGRKALIAMDAESGLVHTLRGTAGHVSDVVYANSLLHGQATDIFADAGYQRAHKRADAKDKKQCHVGMRAGLRQLLDRSNPMDEMAEQIERIKASTRAKVEPPFRVIKRRFGHLKVRHRGWVKKTAQLNTLFALANLWIVRKRLTAGVA